MGFIRNQRGLTIYEVLILTPFILYFGLFIITAGEREMAKFITSHAAKEAHRVLAVTHNADLAKDIAIEKISAYLPTEWSLSGVSKPHKAFDPHNSNSKKDFLSDVYVQDNGVTCQVGVRYHLVTPAPGIAKIMDSDAALLERYLDVESVVTGHREFEIP